MERDVLYDLLVKSFEFVPTDGQLRVMRHLSAFILSDKPNPTYLLQGYAGTGKTSLVKTLTTILPQIGMNFILLAPTGRAAKVMSEYTNAAASTIHRKLYRFAPFADGSLRMSLAENKSSNTVFIVDECSMISEQNESSGGKSLLDDLISFVFNGKNCKLLLIGDSAQLPPVGLDFSPANDIATLKRCFNLTIASFCLTEVLRQSADSGILFNATLLRQKILENNTKPPFFDIKSFKDIVKATPETFEEMLFQSFGENKNDSIIICRSNKRANMFNQAIRNTILQEEGELSAGDRLMVVKNNYFWTDNQKQTNFIANGDMIEILKINKFEEMYGFHFADVEIRLTDYDDSASLSVKILIDTLTSDSPALSQEESKRLFSNIEEDYLDIGDFRERRKAMKQNLWFNALQVKFGYALTCHKTQGGQWDTVYIDAPFKPDGEEFERNDLRWLYTAITRASKNVVLVNFKDEFFA